MEINLPPDQEAFVRKGVEAGIFPNVENAIEQAVSFFQGYQEDLADLRAEIQVGIDDIENGRFTVLNDQKDLKQFFEAIKKRGRERFARENISK